MAHAHVCVLGCNSRQEQIKAARQQGLGWRVEYILALYEALVRFLAPTMRGARKDCKKNHDLPAS